MHFFNFPKLSKMRDENEYDFDVKKIDDGEFRFLAKRINQTIPFMMALDLLERKDSNFLESFLDVLKTAVPFKAYYFETPPMTEIKVIAFLFIAKQSSKFAGPKPK